MATYAEQLAEVQAAISAILTRGQSYRIADREYTRPDLNVLHEMEKNLRRMVTRESRGGARVRTAAP